MKEPVIRGRKFPHSERHLQAVWFDSRWRPRELITNRGERVEVEFPGRWNLEAGPDFLGATFKVGPDERRLTGDVEIHIFTADWNRHGHRDDPRYRNVCLHVTYFEGVLPDDELPPGTLQLALRPLLKSDPSFAFEQIDVTSYPYAGRADEPPCRNILSTWPMEARGQLLDAAGHERMKRKADFFSEAIRERGIDQTLYESVMSALGYQHNKQAFNVLAGCLPLETLRSMPCHPIRAYALLSGMSGLLPVTAKSGWDEETLFFVRSCWDIWWKERENLCPPMSADEWRVHGIRPMNHPLRRMMAAAYLFTGFPDGLKLLEHWVNGPVEEFEKRLSHTFHRCETDYWAGRVSLGSRKNSRPTALVGRDRLESIALNIVIPMAAACGFDPVLVRRLLEVLRPEPMNQIMKQAENYLFGPDIPAILCKSALRRQGLQQVFQDYCLHDRSRCSHCTFPSHLAMCKSGLSA